MAADAAPSAAPPRLFLLLLALAYAGGAIGYVPFLTLVLPLRVVELAGADSVRWLAYLTFVGALGASTGAILFGAASDRTGHRLRWAGAGLVCSLLLLQLFPLAASLPALLGLILAWQLSLNMLLGPVAAYAADRVPRGAMGRFGGLVALSPAAGALTGVIVTHVDEATMPVRLAMIAAFVAVTVLPLLLVGPRLAPPLTAADRHDARDLATTPARARAARMAIARLFVQIAEATLFAYLLLYFRSIDPTIQDSRIASIFSIVLAAAVPLALLCGQLADRTRRPQQVLALAALAGALGLVVMAAAAGRDPAIAGYVLFGLSATVFLSLHSGQMLRALPDPDHRGRDLGFVNLANTLPSLVMPWLAIAVVPGFGFPTLFALLAALATAAALILVRTRL